uniref:Uncharacterized protein n=1 Tax=Rhizophora mucronata TaxID=61149 RepID=A0A2P2Q0U1_RHIMU
MHIYTHSSSPTFSSLNPNCKGKQETPPSPHPKPYVSGLTPDRKSIEAARIH